MVCQRFVVSVLSEHPIAAAARISKKMKTEIVRVHQQFDRSFVEQFYEELMIPNFGMHPDELEDIKTMLWALQHPVEYDLSLILIYDAETDALLGGAACEFYPVSRCALLTYIVVSEHARGRGIGTCVICSGGDLTRGAHSGQARTRMFIQRHLVGLSRCAAFIDSVHY